jgi:heat shock protein HslJ
MTVLLALVAAAAFTQARSAADEPKKAEAKPENKLVGTWKMVSAKYDGKDVTFPVACKPPF